MPFDLVPRKCTATNRIIGAKDHASVQLNIGNVDANGVYTGNYETVVFYGNLRRVGLADASLNRFVMTLISSI